jgi:transcriptional regulator with XRE-family HTH domain
MVDFDAQIIGVRIQQILKDRKIKQKALVALLGLDDSTISGKLTGKVSITLEEAAKISNFLDMPVDELLNGQPGTDLSLSGLDTSYKVHKNKEEPFDNGGIFFAPPSSMEMLLYAELFNRIQQLPERKRMSILRKWISEADLLLE